MTDKNIRWENVIDDSSISVQKLMAFKDVFTEEKDVIDFHKSYL